jgi:tripartite-type tricarboxylate transporter receptor subunit TctC
MIFKKKLVGLMCLLAIGAGIVSGCGGAKKDAGNKAAATKFPEKNIKIIVPYSAGGGVDITTRLFAEAAGKKYFNGKSLVVEDMGGGGAVKGHTYVANAKPDGYTVLAYTSAIVNNPVLKKVSYKTKDFKPLVMVCFDPEILVVPPTSNYKTFEEFVAYAKTHTIKLATPGHSTSHHIAATRLAQDLGLKFEYLHNNSAAVQKQQLMGGHCDAAMMAMGEVTNEVNEGSMIALAVGTDKRTEDLPKVPTFKEKGANLVAGAFRGFAVSAKTPDDVFKILEKDFNAIATSDEFKKAMKDAKIPYMYKNSSDFQAYVDSEIEGLMKIKDLLLKK